MDLAQLVAEYGPVLLFLFLFLDSVGIPLPTEATLLATGALIAEGILTPVASMVAILLGALIGCVVSYHLGARAGWDRLLRVGKRVGLAEVKLDAARIWLLSHGPNAVFFSRFVPFVRCLAGYPAGMVGMPFGRYLVLSLLGYAAWAGLSMTGGYLIGDNRGFIAIYWKELGALTLVAVAGYAVLRRSRRGRHSQQG